VSGSSQGQIQLVLYGSNQCCSRSESRKSINMLAIWPPPGSHTYARIRENTREYSVMRRDPFDFYPSPTREHARIFPETRSGFLPPIGSKQIGTGQISILHGGGTDDGDPVIDVAATRVQSGAISRDSTRLREHEVCDIYGTRRSS